MRQFPTYLIKQKRLDNNKSIVFFHRNYLDVNMFSNQCGKWVFEESFKYYKTKCTYKITVCCEDIKKLFSVSSKYIRINGTENDFSIYIKFPKIEVPFKKLFSYEIVDFEIECSGERLKYVGERMSNPSKKQKNKNKNKNLAYLKNGRDYGREMLSTPNYISWNAMHPYYGGTASHK